MAISSDDILNRSASLPHTSNGEVNCLNFTSVGFLEFVDVPKGCISIDSFETKNIRKSIDKTPKRPLSPNDEKSTRKSVDKTPKRPLSPNDEKSKSIEKTPKRSLTPNDEKSKSIEKNPKRSLTLNGDINGTHKSAEKTSNREVGPAKNDDVRTRTLKRALSPTENDDAKAPSKKVCMEWKLKNGVNVKAPKEASKEMQWPSREGEDMNAQVKAPPMKTEDDFKRPPRKEVDAKPKVLPAIKSEDDFKRSTSKDNDPLSYHWKGVDVKSVVAHASGLFNSRNDCFMNSVLQFVFHTPQLLRYILLKRKQHNCNDPDKCIYCVLNKDYDKITRKLSKFEANSMRNIVNWQFPNRIYNNQEDAHEMLIFLLSKLEPPLPKRNGQSPSVSMPRTPTEMDKIFGGKLCNKIKCENCKNFQTSSEEIRELNLNLFVNQSQRAELIDFIKIFFKIEKLEDYKCDKCDQKGSIRQLSIEKAPNILIIQLKRFRHNGSKNSILVEIPLQLNLTGYGINAKSPEHEHLQYSLYGFISHSGNSANSGHYKATMKGYDGKWYVFDDEYVAQVQPDRFNYQQPYLLFYYRNHNVPTKKSFSNGAASTFENRTPQTFANNTPSKASWNLKSTPSPYQQKNGEFKWPSHKNGFSNGNGHPLSSNVPKRPLNEQNNQNENHQYQNGSHKRPQNGYNSQNGEYRSSISNGFNKNRMFEHSTYHQRN